MPVAELRSRLIVLEVLEPLAKRLSSLADEISESAIDIYSKHGSVIPNMFSAMHLHPINRAAHRENQNIKPKNRVIVSRLTDNSECIARTNSRRRGPEVLLWSITLLARVRQSY